jgi:hypothetical protein
MTEIRQVYDCFNPECGQKFATDNGRACHMSVTKQCSIYIPRYRCKCGIVLIRSFFNKHICQYKYSSYCKHLEAELLLYPNNKDYVPPNCQDEARLKKTIKDRDEKYRHNETNKSPETVTDNVGDIVEKIVDNANENTNENTNETNEYTQSLLDKIATYKKSLQIAYNKIDTLQESQKSNDNSGYIKKNEELVAQVAKLTEQTETLKKDLQLSQEACKKAANANIDTEKLLSKMRWLENENVLLKRRNNELDEQITLNMDEYENVTGTLLDSVENLIVVAKQKLEEVDDDGVNDSDF